MPLIKLPQADLFRNHISIDFRPQKTVSVHISPSNQSLREDLGDFLPLGLTQSVNRYDVV